jgi:hypothetical protein
MIYLHVQVNSDNVSAKYKVVRYILYNILKPYKKTSKFCSKDFSPKL